MKRGLHSLMALGVGALALCAAVRVEAQPASGIQPSAPGTRPGQGGAFQVPLPIRPGQPVSVLVFPFGFPPAEPAAETPPAAEGEAPVAPPADAAPAGLTTAQREVAAQLTAAVKAGFLSTPAYAVATYHSQSSLVQRAKSDEILTTPQLANLIAPATGAIDLDKARNVAYRLSMQTFLIGTIELKTDAKANSAEITLQTQLIDSSTGEVLRSAAVAGAAAGAEGVPATIVRERAALDAAMKLLPAMGIELVVAAATPAAAPAAGKGSKPKAVKPAKAPKPKKAEKKKEEKTQERRAPESDGGKTASSTTRREKSEAGSNSRRGNRKDELTASAAPEVLAQAAPAAPATPPPAVADPELTTPITASVKGTANVSGQPVPYGYALGDVKTVLPPRSRSGFKVPPWLGVAGFLAGISFLL